jgi:gamma-glutamyltranspeptidase/glutathione hydrolase
MNGKRPTIASLHGIVAAAHPLAAQAGARILQEGGNAFDAAVATAAAIGVVEPFMSGLFGNGMATVRAMGQPIRALQFRAGVPLSFPLGRYGKREEMYRGPMATTGPGNLAGWAELLRSHGRKSLAEALAPAIRLARDGFAMIGYNVAGANNSAKDLVKYPFFDEWSRVHTGGAGSVSEGFVLRQPELADTFEAIAAHGIGHLYGGKLGQTIVDFLASQGGCLMMADIEAAQNNVWAEPLVARYRDLEVHVPSPPSQAFQFLLGLRILDGFGLAHLAHNGEAHLDIVWRAIRLAAGARINAGNPAPSLLAELLGDASVDALRQRCADGVPVEGPTEQWIAPPVEKVAGQHTTSLSVADNEGNIVCLTQSLGAMYGNGMIVPGTGVCLNNGLYWGELDPRSPNHLIPGGALMTSVSPSLSTRGGMPVLALGTPGSYGITQTQTQAMVHHVDFGLGLQDAIEAPRARLWDGRRVQAESRIDANVLDALRARGHEVEAPSAWTVAVGGMQGIAINPATGVMTGGADPRREGYVVPA